jgi:hypothetical protein
MSKTVGIVSIVWLGQNIPIEKGAKMTPGGYMSKPVVLNGSWDTANEYVTGKVTCVTRLKKGQSLLAFSNNGDPGELQFNTDTGQQYTDPQAVIGNKPSLSGGDGGKVDLEWIIGEPVELVG